VLAFGSGYSNNNGSTMVKALQRRLIGLGYSPGPVDGRYGPSTEGAVIRFQAMHRLNVDGIAGRLTLAALASAKPVTYPGEGYAPGGSPPVLLLQRELAAAGYAAGPVDGRYGPLTVRAVMRFQAVQHLHVDGIAGPQTAGRLGAALRTRVRHLKRPVPRPVYHAHRHRRAVPPQAHRVSRSSGSLSTVWIVLAVSLIATSLIAPLLAAMRRRMRPRGGDGCSATEPRPGDGGAPALGGAQPAGLGGDLPDLMVPEAEPAERRGRLPATGADGHHEDQGVGAAAFSRGLKLARDGDLFGAEDAFRRAAERGHAGAACNLGVLLEQRGHRAGAKQAYQRADERGDASGAYNLGALLDEQGDVVRAARAYQRADERGDPAAAVDLGRLLAEKGDRVAAKKAFERADRRGHPDAAFDLGAMLVQEGDPAAAEECFRRAAERGHPGAACNLGVLLEQRGDRAGAKQAYQRADERGDASGAYNLGALLDEQGDVVRAARAYRRADERGDPGGAYRLGMLLEREGDQVGAKAAYRRADQRGNPAGACGLGLLLKQEGDRAGALEALQRARDRSSGEVADLANAAMLELAGREEER
jgi:peptidoglycan hydrolase-like protein with peptidoglycan-binding domain/TPR repeat protein